MEGSSRPGAKVVIMEEARFSNNDDNNNAGSKNNVVKNKGEYKRIRTINQDLLGVKDPSTGVFYRESTFRFCKGGKVYVGVFPVFPYMCEVTIPDNKWTCTRRTHYKHAKKKVAELCQSNHKFKQKLLKNMSEKLETMQNEADRDALRQDMKDLINGTLKKSAPIGYVWHHNEKTGIMQLVDKDLHDKYKHKGGYSIWKGEDGLVVI